jgi:arginine repressor
MIVTIIGNLIEMLLKKQESVTSEDIKMLLKRANIQVSESEFIKALMTLEIYKKIHVKRIKREGKEIFQITRRR